MSKDISSLVPVVTLPSIMTGVLQCGCRGRSHFPLCLCLGTADSRLGPRSPRLQAPAAACSRGAAACRGLQQPAARCIHWTHPPPAGAQTHNNCFQSLHLTMDPGSNFLDISIFLKSHSCLFLAPQYQGSSTSNSSNSSFLKTLGLPPGPLGKSLQYMCRTLSPSRSPATLKVKCITMGRKDIFHVT